MTGVLAGRTCLVTGANTGIGEATARGLAELGATVVLTARAEDRAAPIAEAIRRAHGADRADVLALELSDLDAVRASAEEFLGRGRPVHVLINNAGLAGQRGRTKQGFELAFGVNHLGPYLFTRLLWDRLLESAPSRIVNVASIAHTRVSALDFDTVRGPTRSLVGFPEYPRSKLANVLFTKALVPRLAGTGVVPCALHPGLVASSIWRPVPAPIRWLMTRRMITSEEGARTSLHCAQVPDLEPGGYYVRCRLEAPNPIVHDPELVERLWRESAAWVGLPP